MLEILPGSDSETDCVCVFEDVSEKPVHCRGFIRGEEDDLPELVAFQQNCGHGAFLATVSVFTT